MKKLHLLVFFLCCVGMVQAQIKKGTKLIGGQTSFFESQEMATVSGIKTNARLTGISFGKAYKDNKIWGLTISNGFTRNKYYNNGSFANADVTNQYLISTYLRNYYRIGKKWYFALQPEFALSTARTKSNAGSTEVISQKIVASDLSIAPGIVFALTPKWHIEAFVPGLASAQLSSARNYNAVTGAFVNKENVFLVTSSLASGIDTDLISLGFRFLF